MTVIGIVIIAVVLKTLSSPYWKYVEAGAKAAGEELGVDVTIVGSSAESQIMEQVNMIEDSLNQSPYDMGYQGVENALKTIKGEKVDKRIDSGIDVITKDNAKEKLDFLNSISN